MHSTLYRRGSDGTHTAIYEHGPTPQMIRSGTKNQQEIDEYDLIFDTGVPITSNTSPAQEENFLDIFQAFRPSFLTGSLAKLKNLAQHSIGHRREADQEMPDHELISVTPDDSDSGKQHVSGVTKKFKKKRGPLRKAFLGLQLIVGAYAIFYIGLAIWTAQSVQTTNALPHHHIADTPGENWLLVGSDSRKGLSFQDMKALHTGMDHSSQRTDTIMIVHFGGKGPATLVSLPRDSYVTIPMHKNSGRIIRPYRDKINSAFAIRPSLLVSTVEYNTGLHIDHYMQVGFGGIRDLTDALSGVRMCVPQNYRDIKSGLDVKKGCQTLNGKDALAYVRMRYVDPRGDIGRIERQQEYLGAVLHKATAPSTLLNPFAMVGLSRATTKSLTLGHGDGVMDLGKLGLAMGKVMSGQGTVRTVPLSSTNATTSAGSSVLWNKKYAKALFRKLGAR